MTRERRSRTVSIRRYEPGDAPRLKAITTEAFAPVSIDAAVDRRWPGLAPLPWAERKWDGMRPLLLAQPEHCWVADAGGTVVGYVTCDVRPDLGIGRIPDLAVDRHWRGRGLGRRLLERALEHFRELGLPLAKIETLSHNETGRYLYPSMGFELVATQFHYVMALQREGAPSGGRKDDSPPGAGGKDAPAGDAPATSGPEHAEPGDTRDRR
jgi:ribosomal protein S18 acetylase RimI-like enzyme